MARASTAAKNAALVAVADAIEREREALKQANARDLARAREKGHDAAFIDRLTLADKAINTMVEGLRQVAALADPIGEISGLKFRPSGIQVGQMRVPLGVIGIIYESRPNVTIDAAALCLKSGNATILRGGSEAIESNTALAALVAEGGLGTITAIRIAYACWLPPDWVAGDGAGGGVGENWRIDPRRAGGGALIDLAPHGLDLAGHLLGEPLVEVLAMGQARVHPYAVEDGAMLLARSRSGVLVQMHVAYNCPETLPRRRLEVVGTAGMAVATDTMGQTAGGRLEVIDAATGVASPVAVAGAERSPFLNQVEAFADALLGRGPFPFPPERDLATMALLLRAQAMARPVAPADDQHAA
jgi:hypothetical protein